MVGKERPADSPEYGRSGGLASGRNIELRDRGKETNTSTGKVQKFVLREREWAGRDSRISCEA